MDDDENRVPDEHTEFDPDYTAKNYHNPTVPDQLSSKAGLSRKTLVMLGLSGALLVGGGGLYLAHSMQHDSASAQAPQTSMTAAPANAGQGGISDVSSIDTPNPFDTDSPDRPFPTTETSAPSAPFKPGINSLIPGPTHTPFVGPRDTPTPFVYHPYTPAPVAGDNAAGQGAAGAHSLPDSRMKLEAAPSDQANGGNGNPEDAQAAEEVDSVYSPKYYVPVYDRHGVLRSVVPVPVRSIRMAPQGNTSYGSGSQQPYYGAGQPQAGGQPYYGAQQQYGGQPYYGASNGQPAPANVSPQAPQAYVPPASGQFASGDSSQGDEMGVSEHERFVHSSSDSSRVGYVPDVSRDELVPSTIINARLLTTVQSSQPGTFQAVVTTPVYDSKSESRVVIPVGTKLFGAYDSAVVRNQNSLLMAVQQLIFPDAEVFDIGGEQAANAQGISGVSGDVDYHRGSLYTSAALLTVLGAAETALSGGSNSCSTGGLEGNVSVGQSVQCGAGQQINNVGNRIIQQNLNRPPTITIRPPYEFEVTVTRMLPLDCYKVQPAPGPGACVRDRTAGQP